MTALLPARLEEPVPVREPWRDRLQPLVTGTGGWGTTLAVTLLAGLLRFLRLALPDNGAVNGKIFDEVYYSCDALNLLRYGVEHVTRSGSDLIAGRCDPVGSGSFVVHPPLGKWAIAVGIHLFGNDLIGWRVSAAVAGTLTVLIVVRVGRRMTGSTLLGGVAGLLVSVDGLHFVQSRVSMLDVFLVLWTTAAFACLVVDRDHVRAALATAPGGAHGVAGPRLGLRPWRLAAGICLGCALATKWSALYYVAVLAVLALLWEAGARRTAGVRAPLRAALRRSTAPLVGVFGLVPLGVYLLSWTGWFATSIGYDRQWADTHPASGLAGLVPDPLRSLWQYHREVYAFHEGLSTPHLYQSHPVGWLLLARPVSYYYPQDLTRGRLGCAAEHCSREVLAIGNPVLWWGTLPVLAVLVWLWLSRRDWRAGALVPLVLAAIVPWVRDDLHHRTMFLFYALPAVPFMALGAALVIGWLAGGPDASLRRRRLGIGTGATYVALAVAVFAFFYPVLAAQTIPLHSWQQRMWISSWL